MKMSIKKSEKIDWKEAEVNLTKKEITESIKKLHGWRLKGTTIEKLSNSTTLNKLSIS
jgi:hypothetical protein